MSRLSELLAQAKTKDAQMGADLEREFKALSSRLPFGLNFERHRPEVGHGSAGKARPVTRHASRDFFEQCTQQNVGFRILNHAPAALPEANVPVVCPRILTGGGRTLVGRHAIGCLKRTLTP